MAFVLNKGNSKTLKLKQGIIINIPKGAVSLVYYKELDDVVKNNVDLNFITEKDFFELNNKIPTKEKIKIAVKKESEKRIQKKEKESDVKKEKKPNKEEKKLNNVDESSSIQD